jgi:hypothetical protein
VSNRLVSVLDRLVVAATNQGSSMRDALLPGLGEDAIRSRLSPLGLEPPPELIALFGWHNGVDTSSGLDTSFGPAITLPTLEYAEFLHGLVQEFLPGRVDFGEIEHAHWFPVVDRREAGPVVMDWEAGSPSFGSVFGYEFEFDIPSYRPTTLAEPMERWVGYIEHAIWRRRADDMWIDYREDITREADTARGNLP